MNLTFMAMALQKLRSNYSQMRSNHSLFEILDFNPAVKVTNITLGYENDENDIGFGVAEKKMD